jgi:seryl-tRNA synthetase
MSDFEAFGEALVAEELLVPTGVMGIYGRSAPYSKIATGLHDLVDAWAVEVGAMGISFPPVVNRNTFESTNYVQSFPDLMGSVHVFTGDDRAHAELCRRSASGKDWGEMLEPSEVFLASAIDPAGRFFNVQSYCFRHEPSSDPSRMQSFQMHEVVFVGSPDDAQLHRDAGLEVGVGILESLGLDMSVIPANDPFFGRLGTAMAANQQDEVLKREGITPIGGPEHPVAIISGNCHRDHFGHPFEITLEDGSVAHSACVAFGIDRITMALFWKHGLDIDDWPDPVTATLWP